MLAPAARSGVDVAAALLGDLPAELPGWSYLAQDQYLEMRTLLAGYLLSAQGDRMLMGNSVEGRFPFLDRDVVELAGQLPDAVKLRALDEKHVLKRLGRELLPGSILRRPKQPYRAPDALSFLAPGGPAWIERAVSEEVTRAAGVFEVGAVTKLWQKCRARADATQLSNTDNMAVVAVMSTHLVWEQLIAVAPAGGDVGTIRTVVDRVERT
jgi:asparagine synthase (glutamine-hydrolysing)